MSQKSWYSWGTPFNRSSCCAVNVALASSRSRLVRCGLGACWVPLGDSRKVVLTASWQILSMVLLLTSLMSIPLGASLGTSGSVFHGYGLWNVIFISTQSMLRLCWVSQSSSATEYSSSSLVTNNSIVCDSPVENVMGMWHVLLTVDIVEPLNILSRIAFSRCENFNLFFRANVSFIKMCANP